MVTENKKNQKVEWKIKTMWPAEWNDQGREMFSFFLVSLWDEKDICTLEKFSTLNKQQDVPINFMCWRRISCQGKKKICGGGGEQLFFSFILRVMIIKLVCLREKAKKQKKWPRKSVKNEERKKINAMMWVIASHVIISQAWGVSEPQITWLYVLTLIKSGYMWKRIKKSVNEMKSLLLHIWQIFTTLWWRLFLLHLRWASPCIARCLTHVLSNAPRKCIE